MIVLWNLGITYSKRKGDPMPTLEIKQAVVKLLYQIAQDLLKRFDMYEY